MLAQEIHRSPLENELQMCDLSLAQGLRERVMSGWEAYKNGADYESHGKPNGSSPFSFLQIYAHYHMTLRKKARYSFDSPYLKGTVFHASLFPVDWCGFAGTGTTWVLMKQGPYRGFFIWRTWQREADRMINI